VLSSHLYLFSPSSLMVTLINYKIYTYQGVSIFLLGIVIFILIFLALLAAFIYFRDIPEIKDILRKGLGLVEREEFNGKSYEENSQRRF